MALTDPMLDPEFKYSINRFPGDGATTVWELNFAGGYLRREHVKAYTEDAAGNSTEREVVFLADNQVRIEPAVALGTTLVIYRDSPKDTPLVDFTDGSVVNEFNLDLVSRQSVFAVAEMVDRFVEVAVNAEAARVAAVASTEDAAQAVEDSAAALGAATAASALATETATEFASLLATVEDLVGEDLSMIPRLDAPQTWTARQQFVAMAVQDGDVGMELTTTGTYRLNDGEGWGPYLTLNAWGSLSGKPGTFPPDPHSHPWGQITGKPTTFPPEAHTHSYSSLTGIPAAFPPSAHRHPWSDLDGVPNLAQQNTSVTFTSVISEGQRIPKIQVITGTPTGGQNGDVWFVV